MNSLIVASGASQQGVTMSSREIAELCEKEHRNVMADIRKMLAELGLSTANFSAVYQADNGQQYECFNLPRRECDILIAGYNIKYRAAIVDRWQELESRQQVTIPQSYAEALLEAGRLAKIAEEQAAQLAIAAPKAEFVDKYVEATGLKGFRQVAKLLKANEARFREFLIDKKIMYRLGGEWHAYQNHIDAGRFDVKTGSSDSGHAFNQTKFTPKGVNWIAGLWAQHNLQEVA